MLHEDQMNGSDPRTSTAALCYLHASNINFKTWRARGAATSQGDRDEEKCFCSCRRPAIVAGSMLAAQQPAPNPRESNGLFRHQRSCGDGANLGGLQGPTRTAEARRGVGQAGAGDRVWRAYLSTQGPNAVNARDRIGRVVGHSAAASSPAISRTCTVYGRAAQPAATSPRRPPSPRSNARQGRRGYGEDESR